MLTVAISNLKYFFKSNLTYQWDIVFVFKFLRFLNNIKNKIVLIHYKLMEHIQRF